MSRQEKARLRTLNRISHKYETISKTNGLKLGNLKNSTRLMVRSLGLGHNIMIPIITSSQIKISRILKEGLLIPIKIIQVLTNSNIT